MTTLNEIHPAPRPVEQNSVGDLAKLCTTMVVDHIDKTGSAHALAHAGPQEGLENALEEAVRLSSVFITSAYSALSNPFGGSELPCAEDVLKLAATFAHIAQEAPTLTSPFRKGKNG